MPTFEAFSQSFWQISAPARRQDKDVVRAGSLHFAYSETEFDLLPQLAVVVHGHAWLALADREQKSGARQQVVRLVVMPMNQGPPVLVAMPTNRAEWLLQTWRYAT